MGSPQPLRKIMMLYQKNAATCSSDCDRGSRATANSGPFGVSLKMIGGFKAAVKVV